MCTYLYKITTIGLLVFVRASRKMDATSLGGNVVNLDDTISSLQVSSESLEILHVFD